MIPDDEPPFGECADCGHPFWLTDGERRFFAREGLPWPKRCAGCRARKRRLNERRGERPASVYAPSWRPSVDTRHERAEDKRTVGRVGSTSRRF